MRVGIMTLLLKKKSIFNDEQKRRIGPIFFLYNMKYYEICGKNGIDYRYIIIIMVISSIREIRVVEKFRNHRRK